MASEDKCKDFVDDFIQVCQAIKNFVLTVWRSPVVKYAIQAIRFTFRLAYLILFYTAAFIVAFRRLPPRQQYDMLVGLLIIAAMINCMIIVFTS